MKEAISRHSLPARSGRTINMPVPNGAHSSSFCSPSYTLMDFALAANRNALTISLYANNLTDETPVYDQELATSPDAATATNYFRISRRCAENGGGSGECAVLNPAARRCTGTRGYWSS